MTIKKPPACFTMPYTVAKPKPDPRPFVEKKGSKMRRCTSSLMPVPESRTLSCT